MSLARTALRLATVEALRPSAALPDGPWPTLAGAHVMDSALDPVDDLDPARRQAVISIYTEQDDADSGQSAGGPPFRRAVELVLEISMVALGETGEPAGGYAPLVPVTDAELEASLDLVETQIMAALLGLPSGRLWRRLTGKQIFSKRSVPFRTGEERIPLAQRTLTLRVRVPDDCLDPTPTGNETGLDRLPHPLREVAAGLIDTAYGRTISLALAGAAPAMPPRNPLDRVNLGFETVPPSGVPDGEPDIEARADLPQD
jgi:hypothetical protein